MKRITLIFIVLFPLLFFAQNTLKKDIKVGLVLSGGGAKGFAHVAVLKALEETGVRIDYIGGTSMGAIVGALYASGYNATELDSIIRVQDFGEILKDEFPRKSKSFYEKIIGEKYAITLPIKNKKIGVPLALSKGQGFINTMSKLTQHVSNIQDFSKLPIPFLCIATNLENGKQEVLTKGFLPEAVAASGAFPTLISPIEINEKLLTDGGVANNFPVDEVKAMGADIIIGVDIQTGLEKKENLNSAVKILNQIAGFQMYKTLKEKHKKVNVLIKPNLEKYNVVSFDKLNEIVEEGKKAVEKQLPKLKEIAKNQFKRKKTKINKNIKKEIVINKINVVGNKHYTHSFIVGKLNLKKKDTLTYQELTERINNLYGTRNFDNIQYRVSLDKTNKTHLYLKVKETEVNNFLQLGLHYNPLYKTGFLINTTFKHMLFKNDILSADLILGDNVRYNFNYFVDNGFHWSFGLRSNFNQFNTNFYVKEAGVNKLNLEYKSLTNKAYLQTVFGRRYALGLGGEHKLINTYTETVTSINNSSVNRTNSKKRYYFDKSNYLNAIAYIYIDTYDRKMFPKVGFNLDAKFRWYLASSNYRKNFSQFSQLKGKLGFAKSFLNNKLTIHNTNEIGITFGKNKNTILDFIIGGYGKNYADNFVELYGYDFASFTKKSFLKSEVAFRYELFAKHYLMTSANVAKLGNNILEDGKLLNNLNLGYKLGYGVATFLGPIEINYTFSPKSKSSYWYFTLGYWF